MSTTTPPRARLFSGIQPTGTLHVGNYLGAIQNWVRLQHEVESIFCVVDLHAITIDYETEAFATRTLDLAATLLACGVDPAKATLFVQSSVPAHAELAWVLATVTAMGDLARMTQFKDKSEQNKKNINAGLFTYPVLQTADIVLYKATQVPVGEDQVQHIELAREIVRRFNARFGDVFPEPKPVLSASKRILGLDGQAKMSKSLGNHIAIDEEPPAIAAKLRTAYTDPQRLRRNDPGRPEICNIFTLHQSFSAPDAVAEIDTECRRAGIGCFDCKMSLAAAMETHLGPIRERLTALRACPDEVRDVLAEGGAACRAIAADTMAQVHDHLGTWRP